MTALFPQKIFVLAAGYGTRMAPLTNTMPKPLVKVAGRPLLQWVLDAPRAAEVPEAVVNCHYFAEQIEAHLATPQGLAITISDEREQLLETGGAHIKARDLLGDAPYFATNADSFWAPESGANLRSLAKAWQDEAMDVLLLLASKEAAVGYHGQGDFFMDSQGRLTRRGNANNAPFVYSGTMLLHPRILTGAPCAPFSFNQFFDKALAGGRLFGIRGQGQWLHVGDPAAIQQAEQAITKA
ncbi:nucleotidyltransferase family protein [Polycladidibacter hongkongensis]|uniref:nucleotidyltransferase family protein n=1 Tax=Polycladidibacter hongkongensis TaxID=1647556 RepID=UPI000829CBA1|nr:nucleotidyltransferase family protein [Pseudovibrio hongkongensis]